ncbi:hypothetical protein FQZ97_915950 [compost metagenome]
MTGTVGVPALGVVRVDAGSAEQPLAAFVQLPAQVQRVLAFFQAGAGHQHLADTGGKGASEQCFTLFGEAWVSQIDADVDELHGATCWRKPGSIAELLYFQ